VTRSLVDAIVEGDFDRLRKCASCEDFFPSARCEPACIRDRLRSIANYRFFLTSEEQWAAAHAYSRSTAHMVDVITPIEVICGRYSEHPRDRATARRWDGTHKRSGVPILTDRRKPSVENGTPRTCRNGIHLSVRKPDGQTATRWYPCRQRTCSCCRVRHAAARVAAIPEDRQLYVCGIDNCGAQRKALARRRERGEPGDYLRIGERAVVSDAPIGTPVPRDAVRSMVEETPPARGHVSASQAWTPTRKEPKPKAGGEDVRVLRNPAGFERAARTLGIEPVPLDEFRVGYGRTTAEQYEAMCEAGRWAPAWTLEVARARAAARSRHRRQRTR
jgi:hypothetical protein